MMPSHMLGQLDDYGKWSLVVRTWSGWLFRQLHHLAFHDAQARHRQREPGLWVIPRRLAPADLDQAVMETPLQPSRQGVVGGVVHRAAPGAHSLLAQGNGTVAQEGLHAGSAVPGVAVVEGLLEKAEGGMSEARQGLEAQLRQAVLGLVGIERQPYLPA